MSMLREVICFLLYSIYRVTHRLPQISSIYFHDPSPVLFEIILKWYKKHNYRVISLNELISALEKGVKPKERLAFISLDDGWRSNIDLLPICEKYNAPITVFVATEPLISGNYWWEYVTKKLGFKARLEFKNKPEIEFYKDLNDVKKQMSLPRSSMTVDELVRFAEHPLVTIQSHTVNHPVITNLTEESLYKELSESKSYLEELLGHQIDVFSYPNGNVGKREIEALKETGYQYAFTTVADDFDVANYNPYLLPRRAMNTNGGKYDNLLKLTGMWYKLRSM